MNRRDRAQLVVAEIEARGTAGEPVTGALVEDAIRRNSLGEDELPKLHREVLWLLDEKGYDVDAPVRLGWWAAAGTAGLALWVLAALCVARLLGAI